MIDTASFIDKFISALKNTFPDRICFVGLQGSYARGEATESSDIDFVIILDNLSCEDVRRYRTMLDALPYRELFCGFLSDADDLRNWDVSDLFQFYHDTKPIIGTLDDIVPSITDDDNNKQDLRNGVDTPFPKPQNLSDNNLITGSEAELFCVSSGLQVTPLFRRFVFTAVIGRFRPVKLPFCIFGLADLTVSKVFFSSLPLRKEVSHQD